MKLSTIIKGSVCVLGLVGVSNVFAAPARADQAAARGAVTIVRPSGGSISVSGELLAPSGTQFPGPLVITPVTSGNAGTNDEGVTTLTINPGTIAATSAAASTSIEEAIAKKIADGTFATLPDVAALVRAYGAGGLE